jgi:tetratricopeptide (TPR) repeat protein
MLLNAEELLALVNGDVEPDRLADLLDRLENCQDSAAALQVLVALRANREEGMEALRRAEEAETTPPQPILHPSARRSPNPSTGWGMQALRLAASIAIVAVVGVWGATTYLGSGGPNAAVTSLATDEYRDLFERGTDVGIEATSVGADRLDAAASALVAKEYEEARALLRDLPDDAAGFVPMYRGMSEYFLKNYEVALEHFDRVDTVDTGVRHQASWYQANALLALDRPFEAMIVLGQLRTSGYPYKTVAADAYEGTCEVMGIKSCSTNQD